MSNNVAGSVIVLLIATGWGVFLVAPALHRLWFAAVVLGLTALAGVMRAWQAVHLGLFTALFVSLPLLHPGISNWPFYLLAPIFIYLLISFSLPALRRDLFWLRPGAIDKSALGLMILTIGLAAVALGLWYVLSKPEMERYMRMMPDLPLWMLPLAGLAFSTINAAAEEFTFRGIILQTFDSTWGAGIIPLLIQAALFGLLHYQEGFPNGVWGVGMTFVYGFMLGLVRRKTQGLFAPWLVHVGADVVVFVIVILLMYTPA